MKLVYTPALGAGSRKGVRVRVSPSAHYYFGMYTPRTIDLHAAGDVPAALEQLERALFGAYQAKEKQLRVIYGIGEGVLRGAVLEALRKNPMVRRVDEEDTGGSCVVSL